MLGPVVQSVASLITDPGVLSSIPALSHVFMEIDHEIFSSHSPPSTDSRRAVVSYKQKYMHEVTYCLDITIAVAWDIKPQTKQKHLLWGSNLAL